MVRRAWELSHRGGSFYLFFPRGEAEEERTYTLGRSSFREFGRWEKFWFWV
jgi:hypothetical protein